MAASVFCFQADHYLSARRKSDRHLFEVGQLHGLSKSAGVPTPVYALSGRLYATKEGWLMLSVPNAVVRGLFDALHVPGVELPLYQGRLEGHISVARPTELAKIGGPDKVTERGHQYHYNLGQLKVVEPDGWPGISKCYLVEVRSPELEKLRRSYGLSSLPKDGKYAFHITLGVVKKHVLRENDVVKGGEKQGAALTPDPLGTTIRRPPSLVFVSTSSEDKSRSRAMLLAALRSARGRGHATDLIDLRKTPLPYYPDDDAPDSDDIRRRFNAADGVIMAGPVHNWGPAASTVNAMNQLLGDDTPSYRPHLLMAGAGSPRSHLAYDSLAAQLSHEGKATMVDAPLVLSGDDVDKERGRLTPASLRRVRDVMAAVGRYATAYGQNRGVKQGAVIAHIAGPSGAGKSTVLERLGAKNPGLITKDLDDFDDQGEEELGFAGRRKSTFTDDELATLAQRRQELMDKWLGEQGDKPVVLGGHHTEAEHVLRLPESARKVLLSTSPLTSAWRGYRRSQRGDPAHRRRLSELWGDWADAKRDRDEILGFGYEKMRPAAIQSLVTNAMSDPTSK